MTVALGKRAPTSLPFLEGEPLYYHWFAHAHFAAASHATGIEPYVILTRLGVVPMLGVIVLGTAMLVRALSRSDVAGLTAAALLVIAANPAVSPGYATGLDPLLLLLSPTTAFGQVLLVGFVAVGVAMLSPSGSPPGGVRVAYWVVAVVLLGAMSGAKSSMLPIVIGGLVSVLLMWAVTRTRPAMATFGLLGIAVGLQLVAARLIYGGSTAGTALGPLGIAGYLALDLRMVDNPHQVPLRVTLAFTLLLVFGALAWAAGIAGLFTRDQWRDPRAHFLVGAALAGLFGALAFDNAARNQIYFLRVTPVLFAVASGGDSAVLARRLGPRRPYWSRSPAPWRG